MNTTYVVKHSSCISEISHDGVAIASVRFTSNPAAVYNYYPVTGAQVKRIASANSVGKMFHEEIATDREISIVNFAR